MPGGKQNPPGVFFSAQKQELKKLSYILSVQIKTVKGEHGNGC